MRHNFTEEDIQELIYLANGNSCNARDYGLLRNFIDKIVKRQHDLGAIKIPVEVDIQDGYWEAYSADLARDIAVKCAGTDVRSPKEIADYATEIARSVVENLKK